MLAWVWSEALRAQPYLAVVAEAPLYPGGIAKISRRLSAATPPDQNPKTFLASRRDASTSSCPLCP